MFTRIDFYFDLSQAFLRVLKDGVIRHGKVEMTDEELAEAQNPKVRTTIFLEADLIRAYRNEAAKRGLKYQQLMREKLRASLTPDVDIEERLRRIEKKIFKKAISQEIYLPANYLCCVDFRRAKFIQK